MVVTEQHALTLLSFAKLIDRDICVYVYVYVRVLNNFESCPHRIIVFRNIYRCANLMEAHDSYLLFFFFFFMCLLLLYLISNKSSDRWIRDEYYQGGGGVSSCSVQICGKLTTTNDQLTFRRLHPQLFHAFPDLFEVRVRDPHAIGHEFVARRIGQRAVTSGHHGSAAFLASGHLNCSQDNTHG